MTRRPVNTFEDVVQVQVPNEMLQQAVNGFSIYQKDRAAATPAGTVSMWSPRTWSAAI
jgi:hypothetical protein